MIDGKEWRQICTAIATGAIGVTGEGEGLITVSDVLRILRTHAVEGCTFNMDPNGVINIQWPKGAA